MGPGTHQRDVTCPRCGYDLSGTTDTWRELCPVEGICSECGLQFAWCEVLDPLRDVPAWLFEYARDVPHMSRAFVSNAVRTLLPLKLWRDVKMAVPVRRRRLAAFLLVGMLLWWVWGIGLGLAWFAIEGFFVVSVLPPMAQPTLLELSLEALGETARWPTGSVWSDWSDPLAKYLLVLAVVPPAVFILLGETLRRTRVLGVHVLRVGAFVAVSMLLLHGAATSVYAMLLATPGLNVATYLPRVLRTWLWSTPHERWHVWLVLLPWMLLCWWIACRRYMRLPHAFGIACAQSVITILMLLVVVMLFGQSGWNSPIPWRFFW